ncbi:MAG TPA: glycosyltransferase family 2 protein [Pyrinomonadaceae bacterium]|nr:glycosyltransferase family 2 protein [Pyrinomonadaceae bacterium]
MITGVAQLIFWISLALLAYVYAGYPLLVWCVSKLRPRSVERGAIEPKVTVLITAFNEEAAIAPKIENTLAIEYPKDKLEILVASDGSTDTTDEIVAGFADRGVRLLRVDGRVGKTATQNAAVQSASGDIILFSDATTDYAPDVFQKILPAFADASVGCVAGRLVYVDAAGSSVGKGARNYWSYETFIKNAESDACSLIGASGCLYAVRREAYEAMYDDACSDFLICTNLYRRGLRSVFEPAAVCYEQTNRDTGDEMRMRVRVISQTFADLWRNRDMMNPLKSGFFAVELISHKLLRYAVPLMLAALLVCSFLLDHSSLVYAAAIAGQTAFYGMAIVAWLLERAGVKLSILAMPLYFVLANLAAVIAFYKFVMGERYARWEPIRPVRDPR